jgi:hypothetical protein
MPAPSVGFIAQVLTLPSCTLDSPCSRVAAVVLVFALIGRFARKPVLTYLIISIVFLLVSFLPDIGVASASFPGAGWPYAITLMGMHVTAGFITVLMQTRLTAVEKA